MKHLHALTALALFTAVGCKKDEDKTTDLPQGSFAEQKYYLLETGDLQQGDDRLQGSGALVFASPLNAIQSQDNFALEFTIAEGGSLSLVTHSDSSLSDGLTVQFERAGTELISSLKADGAGTGDNVLSGVDASGPISLAVDVHNNETPAHVLIWNAVNGSYEENEALYNSEDDADAPGVGKGTLWGLVLRNATVKKVERGEPKFTEE
ncbi:MAG TPA: hypothetical protein VFO10_17000 [Oligoflexus sp.]|uniref:hypothetical protein n=1 Tax=Oligoflexus sp. TaxID=1971216 RepID=UPI002D80BC1A|nr:hypothetical protein [Oligoflexus sp.]HET9238959.1 hypothetical protein [Oligoflexus sp.]